MASYAYSPLNIDQEEIRLLHLLPGSFEEDIKFRIVHVPLPSPAVAPSRRLSLTQIRHTLPQGWHALESIEGPYFFWESGGLNTWSHPDRHIDPALYRLTDEPDYEPRYEALSYTWGSAGNETVAQIMSQSDDPQRTDSTTPFEIRRNLASALRHLRHPDKTRTLWIDAICINQYDIKERNAQVKRMARIYSLAQKVVIWLGEESADSQHAVQTLRFLAEQVVWAEDLQTGDAPSATEPTWCYTGVPLPYDEKTWTSLTSLFSREWFDRVWILQEAALANRHSIAQCGHDSIPWFLMRRAILSLDGRKGAPQKLLKLMQVLRIGAYPRSLLNLSRLLLRTRSCGCTDPRDKIYGILSVAPPPVSNLITPKYTLPVAEVYLSTFMAAVKTTKRLDLLLHCDLEDRPDGGPSWVPNWGHRPIHYITHVSSGDRAASGISAALATLQSDAGSRLTVSGLQVSRIELLASALDLVRDDRVQGVFEDTFPSGTSRNAAQYVTGGTELEAVLEVLYNGNTRDRYPDNPAFQTMESIHAKFSVVTRGKTNVEDLKPLETDHRVFFRAQGGYIGAGPAGTRIGDCICIFLGCTMPMLLRPISSGTEYLVVGPCFVHGIMDGESILGAMPHGWKIHLKSHDGWLVPSYFDIRTKQYAGEDPRLPPLPAEWERVTRIRTSNDPLQVEYFKNKLSGKVINSDPRLSEAALQDRGIKLHEFALV